MRKKRLLVLFAALVLLASVFAFRTARHTDATDPAAARTSIPPIASTAERETTVAQLLRWPLILVNKKHSVPENYTPPLLTLSNGQQIDARIYPDLQEMFDAARQAGLSLTAAYCYRSNAQQREVLNEKIAQYRKAGASAAEAKKKALEYVARPGHSEHELGLALDIHAHGSTKAETLFLWLQNHAHLYGFVERYPEDKTEITGISYERWHYRYVGKAAAKVMFEQHWTLEEYLRQGAFDRCDADNDAAITQTATVPAENTTRNGG